MQIVETSSFTRPIDDLMGDGSYRMLQLELMAYKEQLEVLWQIAEKEFK